MALGSTQPLT